MDRPAEQQQLGAGHDLGRFELEVNGVEALELVESDSGDITSAEEAGRLMERLLELLSVGEDPR